MLRKEASGRKGCKLRKERAGVKVRDVCRRRDVGH